MSLKPSFAGQLLALHSAPPPSTPGTIPHTLELYLDYVCPFSAKQFLTFYNAVVPHIKSSPALQSPGLRVIFRQQIQPWHPSSTLAHEAGAAVLRLAPGKFWEFSRALFEAQKEYFDVNVVNETRNQTYRRLAGLASGVTGVEEERVFELLEVSDRPGEDGALNSGNKVTDDIKWMTKTNRLVGNHVTPTCYFDGYLVPSISSSWTKEQWVEWLDENVK